MIFRPAGLDWRVGCAAGMPDQKPRLVSGCIFILSIQGTPDMIEYGVSKAAVHHLGTVPTCTSSHLRGRDFLA